jgi:VIT1/CCC1 family predicted Fe2+/Mn2+ transporter
MESTWVARHLSPGERLGELLFGLIMTLTFTLSAGVIFGDGEGASRDLLIATIGCNVAWGIIDGALLILGRVFDRGRAGRLGRTIRLSPSVEAAVAAVASELDETLEPITSPGGRESLYRDVVNRVRGATPRRAGIRGEDWIAALAVFFLVFFASLPAALPFLFIEDPWIALRVSNALLIGQLFFIGYRWAGYTNANPWSAGIVLIIVGILLVAAAIALGG